MGALKNFVINEDFFQRTAYYMSLTLISLSAPSMKVNGLNTFASKHIALPFFVSSGYILLQYIQFHFAR